MIVEICSVHSFMCLLTCLFSVRNRRAPVHRFSELSRVREIVNNIKVLFVHVECSPLYRGFSTVSCGNVSVVRWVDLAVRTQCRSLGLLFFRSDLETCEQCSLICSAFDLTVLAIALEMIPDICKHFTLFHG